MEAFWRAETDKIGNDHWTPATEEVVGPLAREQQSRREIVDLHLPYKKRCGTTSGSTRAPCWRPNASSDQNIRADFQGQPARFANNALPDVRINSGRMDTTMDTIRP
jgi:hypothetical protein